MPCRSLSSGEQGACSRQASHGGGSSSSPCSIRPRIVPCVGSPALLTVSPACCPSVLSTPAPLPRGSLLRGSSRHTPLPVGPWCSQGGMSCSEGRLENEPLWVPMYFFPTCRSSRGVGWALPAWAHSRCLKRTARAFLKALFNSLRRQNCMVSHNIKNYPKKHSIQYPNLSLWGRSSNGPVALPRALSFPSPRGCTGRSLSAGSLS